MVLSLCVRDFDKVVLRKPLRLLENWASDRYIVVPRETSNNISRCVTDWSETSTEFSERVFLSRFIKLRRTSLKTSIW